MAPPAPTFVKLCSTGKFPLPPKPDQLIRSIFGRLHPLAKYPLPSKRPSRSAGHARRASHSAGHNRGTPLSAGYDRGTTSHLFPPAAAMGHRAPPATATRHLAPSATAADHRPPDRRLRPIIACDRSSPATATPQPRDIAPPPATTGVISFLRLLPWDIALHRLLPRNIVRRITACDRLSPATATPQLRDIAPAGHCHGTSRPANHRLGRTVACDQPSRHTSEPSTTELKNIYVPVIAVSPRPREPLLCQCTKS